MGSLVATFLPDAVGQQAAKPNPLITGKYSVQYFIGGTQTCMVSVYPPLAYVDGKPLKAGSKLEVKFYRSYDGGRTYGTKGVEVVKQEYIEARNPDTGQNRFDPARIDWINCELKTPVDPPDPLNTIELLGQRADGSKAAGKDTTVYLAASIVVGGVESEKNNRFLTFSYATGGVPGLTRYEHPGRQEEPVATQRVNVPSQVLADRGGIWEGTCMLTTYSISEEIRKSPDFNQAGCQDVIRKIDAALGQEVPMKIRITSMVPDDGFGEQGMVQFPGTAEISLASIDNPDKFQTSKGDVVYIRARSVVIIETRNENGVSQFTGHVYESPTQYEMHGPLRIRINAKGQDLMVVHGMWTTRRQK
jgi:hypothetical protein